MTSKEKIHEDLKGSMKAKDELRLSVLRMLLSAVHNRELEKRAKSGRAEDLAEEEVVVVVRSETKKRRDAIAEFAKGGRKDLAEKEAAELKILQIYLPVEISDEELMKVVREVVAGVGEVTQKDFGRVIGEVMGKIRGQASGDRVNVMLKTFFQHPNT